MFLWAHWGGETGKGIPQVLWNEYLEGGTWPHLPAASGEAQSTCWQGEGSSCTTLTFCLPQLFIASSP